MANEKRNLIDQDLLIDSLGASDMEIFAKEVISEAPTVDAVEVVHGRWEDMWGGKYANPRYRCSVCKEKALYKSERDLLGNWMDVQALTPNCPYCMAKLDGGKTNDI